MTDQKPKILFDPWEAAPIAQFCAEYGNVHDDNHEIYYTLPFAIKVTDGKIFEQVKFEDLPDFVKKTLIDAGTILRPESRPE